MDAHERGACLLGWHAAVLVGGLWLSGCGSVDRPMVAPAKTHIRRAVIDGAQHQIRIRFYRAEQSGHCWNAVGRDQDGNVFLGVTSDAENAWVYQLSSCTGRLTLVGDLQGSLRYGGREGGDNGKIHCSFWPWKGYLYFVSQWGRNDLRYGSHLWRISQSGLPPMDLGVPVPFNGNYCLSRIDPQRDVAYMISNPAGMFVRYDFRKKRYTALELTGRNRTKHMPMDGDGNLYIIEDNQIQKFDPTVGRWQTVLRHSDPDADRNWDPITAFTWNADRSVIYFLAWGNGALFRWRVGAPKVEPMGLVHPDGKHIDAYNLHLDRPGRRLFVIGATGQKTNMGLYMVDLRSGRRQKLCGLADIIDKEFGAKIGREFVRVDFAEYGGVTGDGGTMYCGLTVYGKDPTRSPEGVSIVALCAIDVVPLGGVLDIPPVPMPQDSPMRMRVRHPPGPPRAEGIGVVDYYEMAEPPAVAYWVHLTAEPTVPGSAAALLYVDAAKTRCEPLIDRYLLHGRTLKYRGNVKKGYVDTSAGSLEILHGETPVKSVKEMDVRRLVSFEGTIEPRGPWMKPISRESQQVWNMIVTLNGGELVDIGDKLQVERADFLRCLALVRKHRSVRVRVVGEVRDAKPYKETGRGVGGARDVRGGVLVAVHELRILGDAAAKLLP